MTAVNIINDESTDRSVFASLVQEIKYLRSLRATCVTHVMRSQNSISDYLAKFARSNGRTIVWLNSGPLEVIDLCIAHRSIFAT